MVENTVKTSWREGRPALGCWLSIPSAWSAEVMARQGYDYICLDLQHGLMKVLNLLFTDPE